jgi:hypothetical protein
MGRDYRRGVMLDSLARGNYRYLAGERGRVPFCNGVIADPGYEIVRATLERPVPWVQGFAFMERYLQSLARPVQALCGIELRCAEPYTRDKFNEFNAGYADRLAKWDLYADGIGCTARTNIAPVLAAPAEQVLFAFSYTVPTTSERPTFVLSGAAAVGVREGDTSPDGIRAKAAYLIGVLDERLAALGVGWDLTTEFVAYAPQDIEASLRSEVLPRIGSAVLNGLRWFPSRAPVVGTDIELGAHGVRQELRVSAA